MSDWKAKRFWKETDVAKTDTGFTVELDGRRVNTPGKHPLILPTRALAQAVADEWDAQEGQIDPLSMPFTRSANSAIEKVMPQQAAVVAMLAEYGDAELICYRAASPQGLVARQAEVWDPLLDWAAVRFDARLTAVSGVMHHPQDARALARLALEVATLDAFTLTGFHDLVTLSGSLVIGLAALHSYQSLESLWDASRVDEHWQQAQWGADEEASAAEAHKRDAFMHGMRFVELARTR